MAALSRAPEVVPRTGAPPGGEALLQALRADPAFADAVLGDLAEEYALRAARDGVGAARWWYARDALRSAPHLVRSAVRYLGPRGRARLVASFAGVVLASTLAPFVLAAGKGPPQRLVADSVVVNTLQPVRLPMRVLDADGRVLPDSGVRYAWTAGAPVSVSPGGVVTCSEPGDAAVRASLGTLATRIRVLCRPVAAILAPNRLELIVGAPARDVPFEAFGPDGRPVTLLVGRIEVGDSTIATLEGQRIRGRADGSTWVQTLIGNRTGFTSVDVYQPVLTPEGVGPDQRVAVPVRLARGERRAWRLPAGEYYLTVLPEHDGVAKPRLAVAGASCRHLFGDAGRLLCFARTEMSVIVRHLPQMNPAPELSGTLLVWRHRDR